MNRKVLMLAHAYPPYNSMGALRAAKFAKYLPKYGWEPIVVTRIWPEEMGGLEEPAEIRVIRTDYHDRLGIFRHSYPSKVKAPSRGSQASGWRSKLRRIASFWVKELLAYPDEFVGWKPYAVEVARKILKKEDIAIIFSTSPPPTSHLIAHELQRESSLPWVADFRDLWTQNHYIRHTRPRQWLEARLERRVLKNASVLVTVSHPMAEKLKWLHKKPVEVITNGYDEDDYAGPPPPLTPYFSITYTGQLYAGKRDPSLLFAAVRKLLDDRIIDPQSFRIRFYGPERDGEVILSLAARYGIERVVGHYGRVSYQEAILHQRESTILLLLNWLSAKERGVYTGKLFEYLGAKRPILAIPRIEGVVDDLLRETGAGVVAGTVDEIVQLIKLWHNEFQKTGMVSYRGKDEVIAKYTRAAQTRKLARIFEQLR